MYCVWQIVLAILAIIKLYKGVTDPTSATPAYNESHISVPPIAAADYNQQDSQFSPHPFSSPASKPSGAESPAY